MSANVWSDDATLTPDDRRALRLEDLQRASRARLTAPQLERDRFTRNAHAELARLERDALTARRRTVLTFTLAAVAIAAGIVGLALTAPIPGIG